MLEAAFWENERRQLLSILLPRFEQMALAAGQAAARKAGIAFNPTLYNPQAEAWARGYADQVLDELNTTSKDRWESVIADYIARPGATIGELNTALTPFFGRERAALISVTETTRAFASGEELAYQAEGIAEWTWQTNRNELVCRICGPLNGKTVKLGQPFGVDRKGNPIYKPGAHPGCRCWVRPKVGEA
jgi:SPP1 gp7 family putative phage head morphogenesis protein